MAETQKILTRKATVVSPANIAFIKFWGKKDPKLNLPFNNSISMNLSNCLTTTTVEFDPNLDKDKIYLGGGEILGAKKERVVNFLNIVREKANIKLKAKVFSQNNFPQGTGIASSASAFSALALAASRAAGLSLSQKELSILARRGSGSACRSIISGFAEWRAGNSNETSYAVQLAPFDFWELGDIVVVTNQEEKKVSSTEGHESALTSPYFKERLKNLPQRIKQLKESFLKKDFLTFGQFIEEEGVDLHLVAMSSKPPIFYWSEGTMEVIHFLHQIRQKNLFGFFTIDAGPNVHIICLQKDMEKLLKEIKKLKNILFTIVNLPCEGARLINKHLF